jgi:hypothetical protein
MADALLARCKVVPYMEHIKPDLSNALSSREFDASVFQQFEVHLTAVSAAENAASTAPIEAQPDLS